MDWVIFGFTVKSAAIRFSPSMPRMTGMIPPRASRFATGTTSLKNMNELIPARPRSTSNDRVAGLKMC